jgi:hypothetical protein
MMADTYSRPAWMTNGSVRTDLPVVVVPKARKKEALKTLEPGQLFCIGDVYIRTHKGMVRIDAA